MNKKRFLSGLLMVSLTVMMLVQTVCANDSIYQISPEIQAQIDSLIERDLSNADYINSVIENFNSDIHTNSQDLELLLLEVIDSINVLDELSTESFNNAIQAQEELMASTPSSTAAWEDLYISAMGNYAVGINLVRAKGCSYTADYMEHAIVPMDKVFTSWTPATVYHRSDAWANALTRTQDFTDTIYGKFISEILIPDKTTGTITGSYAYTTANSSLDAYTALHNVNYSATFTKASEGYSVSFKITDTYDFAWGSYENFAVGFGNNYCYAMQSNGWIKPFQIIITANG